VGGNKHEMHNYIRQGASVVTHRQPGLLVALGRKTFHINELQIGNPNMISQTLWGEIENSSEFLHTGMH